MQKFKKVEFQETGVLGRGQTDLCYMYFTSSESARERDALKLVRERVDALIWGLNTPFDCISVHLIHCNTEDSRLSYPNISSNCTAVLEISVDTRVKDLPGNIRDTILKEFKSIGDELSKRYRIPEYLPRT